ncbi:hypothetical protein TWF481_001795 [Arthrobotrys musiformis]|uniref:Uncharacterized protein n=1 Tax=Arthrobotrys musiformis TaxID=47236 RepID=A0AAV9VW48_9PEZI
MHFIGAAATLLSLIGAASSAPSPVPPSRFATGTAFWPSFKIDGLNQGVTTYYGYFYLGKDTSTIGCDPKVEGTPKCDTMGSSHWVIWYSGSAILDVQVPGGQQIYIDSTGALRYSPPGKPLAIPPPQGVRTLGFKIRLGDDKRLYFSHKDGSFVACPEPGQTDVYKIHLDNKDRKLEKEKKCVPVEGSGRPTGVHGASWYSYLTEPKPKKVMKKSG